MKALLASAMILIASAGTSLATPVTPDVIGMGLWLKSTTPGIWLTSNGARFLYSPDPQAIRMWTYIRSPSTGARRQWRGEITMTQTGHRLYSMTGYIDRWTPNGGGRITFASDGTWACSGDCALYKFFPKRIVKTNDYIGQGRYRLAPIPVPASAFLGLGGLLALFGIRRSRRAA